MHLITAQEVAGLNPAEVTFLYDNTLKCDLKLKLLLLLILLSFQTKCSKKNIEIEIVNISKKIDETSGLEILDGNFLTHNDSGGGAILFTFDNSGKKLSEHLIEGAKNTDWESLASDDKYIYIGDIGNNKGNRKNLRIYLVDFKFKLIDSINFNYSNQLNFKKRKKHEFNAEALVSFNDSLIIFSKNKKKLTTEVYILPKIHGEYSVNFKYSYQVNALISGADYSSKEDLLALVGYNSNITKQFLFVFKNFSSNLNKNSFKKYIIPITNAQIEAIKIINKDFFWLTSENEGGGHPKLIKLKLK